MSTFRKSNNGKAVRRQGATNANNEVKYDHWSYGYYPSGGMGFVLLILIILLLLGRL
ncbi:MAG: DUF3309 family protein [Desulfobacteraceae bacterium]|nr:MAG: DUF3309 family protein [Desulfobacteraceae bacterium]